MKRNWAYILKPAKIAIAIDLFFAVVIGLPSVFIGNPLESFEILVLLGLASRIIFGVVVICCVITSIGLTKSFFRFLTSFGWRKDIVWVLSLIFLTALGFISYVASFITISLVAFGGW